MSVRYFGGIVNYISGTVVWTLNWEPTSPGIIPVIDNTGLPPEQVGVVFIDPDEGGGTGTATISASINNNVIGEITALVPPPPAPVVANFTASPLFGQVPLTVFFTDTSTGLPTSWEWDFTNDGSVDSIEQNPFFTYTQAGVYTIKLRVANSFSFDSTTKTNLISVVVAPPVAGFYGVNPATTITGFNTFFGENLTPVTNVVSGNPVTARASFLSKLTGVGVEDFESATTGAVIPLVVSFPGSTGSITATISGDPGNGTIENRPIPGGTRTGRFNTTGATSGPVSGQWLDAGKFVIDFNKPISAFGFYGTDIGDFNGSLTLTLHPTTGADTLITIPHTINGPSGSVLFYGFIDADKQYTKITFGNTAAGTDFFGFDDFVIGDVNQVIAPPDPNLPIVGLPPLTINFIDTSTGATSWQYDFTNDGTFDSTARNPTYVYNTPGTYTVQQRATNSGGSNTFVRSNYIVVQAPPPVAGFYGVNAAGTAAGFNTYYGQDPAPIQPIDPTGVPGTARTAFQNALVPASIKTEGWEGYDTASLTDPPTLPFSMFGGLATLTSTAAGSTNNKLKQSGGSNQGRFNTTNPCDYESGGCNWFDTSATFTIDFGSNTVGAFGFYMTDYTDFAGNVVTLEIYISGVLSQTLNMGPGTALPDGSLAFFGFTDGQHRYNKFRIVFSGTADGVGFDDFIIGDVKSVAPDPNLPITGTAPLTINFTDTSTGATSWEYDFTNDGSYDSTVRNPTFVYNTPGTYSVTQRVTNSGGNNTFTRTGYIIVQASVLAGFYGRSPTTAVTGFSTYFGENLAPGRGTWGAPVTARTNFLNELSGVGSENFESYTAGTTPSVISFPGSTGSITATLTTDGHVSVYPFQEGSTPGRFNTTPGGQKWLDVGTLTINLSSPISAFGFYGTDIGDFNGQLTLTLHPVTGTDTVVTVPNTINGPSGSLLFFGFIDAVTKYTRITFGNTAAGIDFFGFDDFVIGDVNQIVPPPDINLPITGVAPLTINFTDTSTGATSWDYDFTNDGTFDSSTRNPTYVYNTVGTYGVRQRASAGASNNIATRNAYIIVTTPLPVTSLMTFEGAGDLATLNNFYNGGTDSQSNSGPNFGATFSGNCTSLMSSEVGGSGNFTNEPSPATVMYFSSSPSVVPYVSVLNGFTSPTSFRYASLVASTVTVMSGVNGTGSILATASIVGGNLDTWTLITMTFTGTAKSIKFSSSPPPGGQTLIDNISLNLV